MARLVISAFGVHTGGALVLLEALVREAGNRIAAIFLDRRVEARFAPCLPHARVIGVPVSAAARVAALMRIAAAGPDDRLFCFNNLPPLRRSRAHTITYVHTPYLTGFQPDVALPARERARIMFERALFRLGRANSDAFWVQTPTTARGLARAGMSGKLRLMPFAEGECGPANRLSPAPDPVGSARFIYPASGAPHKNHVRLFQAWRLLGEEGVHPPLDLTLIGIDDYRARRRQAGLGERDLPHIAHLGELSREAVLARITAADALIFPSLAETLGLPLIEAAAAAKPILAAERDFVRDVCVPAETFDPTSARSIADAVSRFLGHPRPPVAPLSPAAFVEAILA